MNAASPTPSSDPAEVAAARRGRAEAIAAAGGVEEAITGGLFADRPALTLAEGVVLGLLRQGVRRYATVLGHGSTELGEVLRVYEAAGLVCTYNLRHETEAAHAATALRRITGEKAAVVTSIGPGALQAFAGALASASDGIGVWHIYADETTHDEGPNMQQIPKPEQALYLRLCSTLGAAYSLHTPEALGPALRRGLSTVDHPHRAGPFFLLLPLNTQAARIEDFNVDELPAGAPPRLGPAADGGAYREAARVLLDGERVVVKIGGGALDAGAELREVLDLCDGVLVHTPQASGVVPADHPRNMTVGGSKGSISGNFTMDEADTLLAVGTRAVCQSDCSRTGYPKVRRVVNVNTDVDAALHYNRTVALVGDAAPTLARLAEELRALAATPAPSPAPLPAVSHGFPASGETVGHGAGEHGPTPAPNSAVSHGFPASGESVGHGGLEDGATDAATAGAESPWLTACRAKRAEWDADRAQRYAHPTLHDDVWGTEVLTQPAAVRIVLDACAERDAVAFFDAGDVQANGFQVATDDRPGRSFTETGASYMGFATCALLATAMTERELYAVALTGDGSFTMNPQVVIDGVLHGATGCIVLLDNRRMAAITGLQLDQYGAEHATADGIAVDYLAWARAVPGVLALDGGRSPEALRAALAEAFAYPGLSLVHVPVYFGSDPLGGLGVYGRWNVGNRAAATQLLRHEIGL